MLQCDFSDGHVSSPMMLFEKSVWQVALRARLLLAPLRFAPQNLCDFSDVCHGARKSLLRDNQSLLRDTLKGLCGGTSSL